MSTAESCSTEDTPNLPDLDENNEVLKKSSKNHSFCSDNGVPPVSQSKYVQCFKPSHSKAEFITKSKSINILSIRVHMYHTDMGRLIYNLNFATILEFW